MIHNKFALILLVVLLCSCNNSKKGIKTSEPKQDWKLIGDAYKEKNWDFIVSIGDTIFKDDDPYNIAVFYAEALAFKGNFEKAIRVLDHKIIIKPDDYYLFNTKGNVYFEAGMQITIIEQETKTL